MTARLTPAERRLVARLDTPAKVQAWLKDEVAYNKPAATMRSFRGVHRHKRAHCLEGALATAFILEHHGHPPLLLDLESEDGLDHVVFIHRDRLTKRWGAVGMSRYPALKGRKPVFRTTRDLAWSYVDPFVDRTGRVTGWIVFDLRALEAKPDWRWSRRDVWHVEQALLDAPHASLRASDARHERWRRRYLAWKGKHPRDEPPVGFYPGGAKMR